jgi:heme-degrading monooxygenase HmoA
MADTWTFSEWSIGDGDPTAFVNAFRRFADAATQLGGAQEGMILQDVEDPAHFVVVRRWADSEAVARWASEQGNHAGELMALAPSGARAAVMKTVADLSPGSQDRDG